MYYSYSYITVTLLLTLTVIELVCVFGSSNRLADHVTARIQIVKSQEVT